MCRRGLLGLTKGVQSVVVTTTFGHGSNKGSLRILNQVMIGSLCWVFTSLTPFP